MTTLTAAAVRDVSAARHDPDFDDRMMAAAINFGRRGLGFTAPNPSVGAILVREGVVVGRGVTGAGGRPHAETLAILDAGEKARGATMYVSLEPCSHFGVTPPCARAIIEAGIARVVSALPDPDSRVAGRGHQMLREAGIEVSIGAAAETSRRANLGHILRVTEGRPFVHLKLAETADGFAAGDAHDPRLMITGQAANNRVQIMRMMADAIMTGIGTIRADDPLLTVRLPGLANNKRLRVVIDTHLELPLRSRIVATIADAPLLVLAGEDAPEAAERSLQELGAQVLRLPTTAEGRVNLKLALAALGARGITRVLSEGGPKIGASLIKSGLADEVTIFSSAKPLGRAGTPSLDPQTRQLLEDRNLFFRIDDAQAGADRQRVWRRKG